MAEMTKPTSTEDEYFVREDAEKKRKLALELKRQTAAADQQRLKELHWMHCPKCGMQMQEIRYGNLDVDACFSCGGVFLDKGEMDVIAHPRQKGIMAAILNWFKDETKPPGR
ncbi:MAG TPA: zf-TFIIB domain-containing protein [Anaeromyxobacteraceae bacterium]|nr:zf-TFIIB domain-containing protein [Anaeromyxobacteraceae bacterium]